MISKQASKQSTFFSETVDSTHFEAEAKFQTSELSPTMRISYLQIMENIKTEGDQINHIK